jgi:hypothetical protein
LRNLGITRLQLATQLNLANGHTAEADPHCRQTILISQNRLSQCFDAVASRLSCIQTV